jgi:hypothetical protein
MILRLLTIAVVIAGAIGAAPPDLQGTWTNATITPFERPDELAGKPVLTPAEAAEIEKKAAENRVDRAPKAGDVGNYNQVWFDSGTKVVSTRQTSLVVALRTAECRSSLRRKRSGTITSPTSRIPTST